ncbi:hypothetical protein K440DRAFT_165038 [Wilcoxina mikolae CBS 423.85]|nr:hypothetical protein K440DRAFT_165038 [Wilcoxina mikolae CBS 423.85]
MFRSFVIHALGFVLHGSLFFAFCWRSGRVQALLAGMRWTDRARCIDFDALIFWPETCGGYAFVVTIVTGRRTPDGCCNAAASASWRSAPLPHLTSGGSPDISHSRSLLSHMRYSTNDRMCPTQTSRPLKSSFFKEPRF